jgi:hypothetical protein
MKILLNRMSLQEFNGVLDDLVSIGYADKDFRASIQEEKNENPGYLFVLLIYNQKMLQDPKVKELLLPYLI